MTKTILYARVSTAEQNADHQRTQAEAAGFKIDEVVTDHAQSGVTTTLAERPEGKRLFDKLRHGDVLLVRENGPRYVASSTARSCDTCCQAT